MGELLIDFSKRFSRFSTFVFENGNKDDAVDFLVSLGVEKTNIFHFDPLKIDDVRRIKEEAEIEKNYRIGFVIGDLSFEAQNALLKLTEEPKEGVYFAFYKTENLLDTIYSRAQVVRLKRKLDIDEDFIKALEEQDKEAILRFLFSLSDKTDILNVLSFLINYYSRKAQIKKAREIMEFFKAYREFNLNEKLLLANIFSVIED